MLCLASLYGLMFAEQWVWLLFLLLIFNKGRCLSFRVHISDTPHPNSVWTNRQIFFNINHTRNGHLISYYHNSITKGWPTLDPILARYQEFYVVMDLRRMFSVSWSTLIFVEFKENMATARCVDVYFGFITTAIEPSKRCILILHCML
jgi:hypothetical protein